MAKFDNNMKKRILKGMILPTLLIAGMMSLIVLRA